MCTFYFVGAFCTRLNVRDFDNCALHFLKTLTFFCFVLFFHSKGEAFKQRKKNKHIIKNFVQQFKSAYFIKIAK